MSDPERDRRAGSRPGDGDLRRRRSRRRVRRARRALSRRRGRAVRRRVPADRRVPRSLQRGATGTRSARCSTTTSSGSTTGPRELGNRRGPRPVRRADARAGRPRARHHRIPRASTSSTPTARSRLMRGAGTSVEDSALRAAVPHDDHRARRPHRAHRVLPAPTRWTKRVRRFRELGPPPAPSSTTLPSATSGASTRSAMPTTTTGWRRRLPPDMQLIDMRAAMRTVTSGREAYLRNFPAMRELGFVNRAVEPLAVRGDRLALFRQVYSGDDFEAGGLTVNEVDEDGVCLGDRGLRPRRSRRRVRRARCPLPRGRGCAVRARDPDDTSRPPTRSTGATGTRCARSTHRRSRSSTTVWGSSACTTVAPTSSPTSRP